MIYFLVAVLLILLLLSKSPVLKGMIGEASIRVKLMKLRAPEYRVLHNIMLKQPDGKTAQIDHVIVSRYGVFVIETKNYRGWIVGNEKSEFWTQVIYRRKEKLYNPIRQNYGHIKALEMVLEDESIPFISIISFSTRAELKLEQMSTEVVYSTQLVSVILKYKVKMITEEHANKIYNALSASALHSYGEHKKHVKNIKDKQIKNSAMEKSGICPKCGGRLVERRGRNGAFIGCTKFPQCRFTSS